MFKYDKDGKKVLNENELNEMSKAGLGDWIPKVDRIYQKSLKQLKAEWEKIEDIKFSRELYLELYRMKNSNLYILGQKDEEGFNTILHIKLTESRDIERFFKKYKKVMNVDEIIVAKDKQGLGIAKFIYRYLVEELGFNILGDELQYHKARLTWVSLSQMGDMNVDIIDIENQDTIDENIKLHHGELEHEFDPRVWSRDNLMKHIRLILTKVL